MHSCQGVVPGRLQLYARGLAFGVRVGGGVSDGMWVVAMNWECLACRKREGAPSLKYPHVPP